VPIHARKAGGVLVSRRQTLQIGVGAVLMAVASPSRRLAAGPALVRGFEAGLNPLLVQQQPGTWRRLPDRSETKPARIHAHAGGVVDPITSVLYFFGSDNHGDEWNNDVWSYDPVTMTWSQSYPEDPPSTYRYQGGIKTTTTGHPWAMHAFAMNAWDPVGRRLVVGVRQMHYGLESLPRVTMPEGAPESWWQYSPTANRWTPAVPGPDLGLGHLCYVPPLKCVIGFDGDNVPVTIYDPEKRVFRAFSGFGGPTPTGYTLKSAYDPRRNRILLVSWDDGPNVWAFDLGKRRWIDLRVKNRPPGRIYGSWDYDQAADAIVSLWPDDPDGSFSNDSGGSRTFLVDLGQNGYREVKTDPAAPYTGMSFRVLYDSRHQVILAVEGHEVWSFKVPPPDRR
jgi:hypothetical protein